jgi:N,N'-diacetyllegionaminate synthase
MAKKSFTSKNGIYVIAEIGGNHEGDFEYAKYLTKLAAESGADAVKFQIYTGETLVNRIYDPVRFKHFKKFQLKKDQYLELAKLCKKLGTNFMASVWNPDAISYIDKYVQIYKIGSGDMTCYDLIEKFLKTSKPLIVSTGLSKIKEVEDVIKFIELKYPNYIKEKKIALLQCTSMYPISIRDANLNVINSYKERFNLPIGYSDHTEGTLAIEVAAAMGSEIIEVHFTDDRKNKSFRDHKVSLTKEELKNFLKYIRKIKKLKGSQIKKPTKIELENNHVYSFRRGVYTSRNIPKGHIISKKDLVTLRPAKGIGAENFFKLIGLKLKQDVKKNEHLNFNLFEKVKKN